MKKKAWLSLVLLIIGGLMIYYGLATPYPIRDMNGDGKIDWKDYDVNRDGKVDMSDIVRVSSIYGSSVGDINYNPRCDFNGDGVIDDYDLNAIKDYFGQPMDIIGLIFYRLSRPKGIIAIGGFAMILLAIYVWRKKEW